MVGIPWQCSLQLGFRRLAAPMEKPTEGLPLHLLIGAFYLLSNGLNKFAFSGEESWPLRP